MRDPNVFSTWANANDVEDVTPGFAGRIRPGIQMDDDRSFDFAGPRIGASFGPIAELAAPWAERGRIAAGESGLALMVPNLCDIAQRGVRSANGVQLDDLAFFVASGATADQFQGSLASAPVVNPDAATSIDDAAAVAANAAPTGITLARGQAFVENAAGAVVGTLHAIDPDIGDAHSFTVSDSRFEVVGNILKLKDNMRLDFETDANISLSVTCTDTGGKSFTRSFSVALSDVDEVRFAAFGDYGGGSGMPDVAALIAAMNVDFIVTTGDNGYSSSNSIDDQIGSSYSDYIGDYTGSFGSGSDINSFFPALGNHDFDELGLNVYLDYFTLPGNERYYDYQMGPIHFFVLDSDDQEPDGRTSTSIQGQWLQAELAKSDSAINIVYFHHAAYSSAYHGSNTDMQWPFEEWGATAVLTGHDHTYERIVLDENNDGTDLPYFVTGLGGSSIYDFDQPVDGSEVRYNDDYGTMLIQASDTTMTFEFWSIANGGTLIDSYTIDLPGANPLLANGNDTIHGGTGDDFINGLSGNDRVHGRAGNDLLIGGAGNDIVFWDPGKDTINGGSGIDSVDYSARTAGVTVVGATGTVTGGVETDRFVLVEVLKLTNAADVVFGGGDVVRVFAAGGDDIIHIGATAMLAFGGAGLDTILGGNGGDDILGGGLRDVLDGAGGGDSLTGGQGNDVITGGTGADHFIFGSADGQDRITDFDDGVDLIDLSGLGLTFGSLAITSYGGGLGTRIAFGTAVIKLEGVLPADLGAADFIL